MTRQYHGALVKCQVENVVGKSSQSEKLDISCKCFDSLSYNPPS